MGLDDQTTKHDFHVSLAINFFLSNFGGTLLFADGKLPVSWHRVQVSPIIWGYRPDAIIELKENNWFIEAKSFGDFYSNHSKKQYKIIHKLLELNESLSLFILVFGCEDTNLYVPFELQGMVRSNRLFITYI